VAGQNQGADDSRDLWPTWFSLIGELQPPVIFGEQVFAPDALLWIDRASEELERHSFAIGSLVLPAVAVGAPHARDRFYFVADRCFSDSGREPQTLRRPASLQETGRPWAFANWNGGESSVSDVDDGISQRLAKSIVRGIGNAIVPQVAQVFIEAYLDCERGQE
jgi:DNA (cytosine-5)-methyltransferase 1